MSKIPAVSLKSSPLHVLAATENVEGVRASRRTQALEAPALRPLPKASTALTTADSKVLEAIRSGTTPTYVAIDELVALVKAGKLTKEEALLEVRAEKLSEMLLPTFEKAEGEKPVATGPAVSRGCASGVVCFDPEQAAAKVAKGERVILVVEEIAPADVALVKSLASGNGGVVCARGGYSSHTAVVSRDFGIPAVNNPGQFVIQSSSRTASLCGHSVKEGDFLSVDGNTGEIYVGQKDIAIHADRVAFRTFMGWARDNKSIDVHANADLPASVERAIAFGASGVGLVRTEHMFFGERQKTLQAAVIAPIPQKAAPYLKKLEEWQQQDFEAIFKAAGGRPVSIRLLDPPTHEMLPRLPEGLRSPQTVEQLAQGLGVSPDKVKEAFGKVFGRWEEVDASRLYFDPQQDTDEIVAVAKELGVSTSMIRRMLTTHIEANPMMGVRGVRLGFLRPEFYDLQIRAILRAALRVQRDGVTAEPRITIPLVNTVEELEAIKARIETIKQAVEAETGEKVSYKLGAMLETPKAIFESPRLAEVADYFSVGSNDLTQFSFGLSRDDSDKLLPKYLAEGLLPHDPAKKLDSAVVEQVAYAANFAKAQREEGRDFKMGLCGEQGADPDSVAACHRAGVDYVSVSPYGIPTAILTSAQTNIRARQGVDAELGELVENAPKKR